MGEYSLEVLVKRDVEIFRYVLKDKLVKIFDNEELRRYFLERVSSIVVVVDAFIKERIGSLIR